jgi:hypothetical protein
MSAWGCIAQPAEAKKGKLPYDGVEAALFAVFATGILLNVSLFIKKFALLATCLEWRTSRTSFPNCSGSLADKNSKMARVFTYF